ncbi:hypothetical protein ACQPZZ_38220 [Microbispora sp. CA-135349]|uniref:hypothetical protein n=1 Tax=Microbispora sp. CA-135349 TaxID=3239953 RepID=UPI003D913E1D
MRQHEVADGGMTEGLGAAAPGTAFVTEQGAATTVWAATAPELSGAGGGHLEDCSFARPWHGDGPPPRGHYLPYAMDAGRADRLWALSERLLAGPTTEGQGATGGM